MQVNHYNSLQVEIHSKLEDELELESVSLNFSGLKQQLNHKVQGPITLKKDAPISVQKELFISFNVSQDSIFLEEVVLEFKCRDSSLNLSL